MQFLTGYNSIDGVDVSRETAFEDDTPSMTQQSFKDECDINTIVRRFGVTGEQPPLPPPASVEFSEVYNFQTAMNVIRAGTESFESLDSTIRARFNNDPAQFMNFVHDDSNIEQARMWGLIPKAVSPIPEGVDKPVDGVPVKP